ARYIEHPGAPAIRDQKPRAREGAPRASGEQERLFTPAVSQQTAPLWRHCQRALEYAARFGSHGLPLFGSGDWNDGMNRVGVEGRGESVWLGWFFCATLEAFAQAVDGRGSGAEAAGEWGGGAAR